MRIKNTNIGSFLSTPDLISLLNLSSGFISILLAINGSIRFSAIAIIFAIIFDSADGWVARKVGRNDEYGFGKNIDSLSDVVSFGVAPGILLYSVCAVNTPEFIYISIIISLFILITGVLRLTRYNVIADYLDFKGFIGLPIPATAMLISTFILTGIFHINSILSISIIFSLMLISSILMVSNIRYSKFNNIKVIIIALILILLVIIPIPISYNGIDVPATILFILTLIFASNLFK
ncbi:MAG: archaetidylserine synthase [Methanobrevibacter sp.]|jgi:archaetidylserine synthase|nr:archaetidylserine synthase [Candidatus Methanovirga meridionalis]